ncbi:hypothetical protein [Psychromicrobium lacuslunae]|uniref:hypothetical protein n=1 Tax=Psychromicrobium lacuslunae TaxID=1618207 RepID=UPI0009E5504C|nr:hypothetical protein [Psychromicrobium lacuslunae]
MRPSEPQSNPTVRFSPSVEAKLSDAAKESLARKRTQAAPGAQSIVHGHKPTQASGRQGNRERKVRW